MFGAFSAAQRLADRGYLLDHYCGLYVDALTLLASVSVERRNSVFEVATCSTALLLRGFLED